MTPRLVTHWFSREPDISANAALTASVFPSGTGTKIILLAIVTPKYFGIIGPT